MKTDAYHLRMTAAYITAREEFKERVNDGTTIRTRCGKAKVTSCMAQLFAAGTAGKKKI